MRVRAALSRVPHSRAERSEVGAPGVDFTPGFSTFLIFALFCVPPFVSRALLPQPNSFSTLKCAVVAPPLVAEKHPTATALPANNVTRIKVIRCGTTIPGCGGLAVLGLLSQIKDSKEEDIQARGKLTSKNACATPTGTMICPTAKS